MKFFLSFPVKLRQGCWGLVIIFGRFVEDGGMEEEDGTNENGCEWLRRMETMKTMKTM